MWSHFKTTQDYVHITPQRYTQVVTGNFARSDYLLFVFPLLIHWQCNHFAKKRYFRETGKIEGNCATRVAQPVFCSFGQSEHWKIIITWPQHLCKSSWITSPPIEYWNQIDTCLLNVCRKKVSLWRGKWELQDCTASWIFSSFCISLFIKFFLL